VFEARERIGGRIFTVRDPRVAHPIELGAEFVHGSAPEVVEVIRDARLLAHSIEGQRWRMRAGRLTQLDDFWGQLQRVMRYLKEDQPDCSFDEILDRAPGGRHAADARVLARLFVEGFHAADAGRISVRALAAACCARSTSPLATDSFTVAINSAPESAEFCETVSAMSTARRVFSSCVPASRCRAVSMRAMRLSGWALRL